MAKNTMKLVEFDSDKAQALALADQVVSDIKTVLTKKDTAVVCVPGGSTPKLFFNALCSMPIDWSRVSIVLTDERWVPLSDPLSNEALLKRELQSQKARPAKIVSLFNGSLPVEQAVEQFNQNIAQLMPIDICILGMGDDGHTASLFPVMQGLDIALDKQQAPALIIATIEGKREVRVSLNLSALLTAQAHYVLIRGQAKKQVVNTACEGLQVELPISYLLAETPTQVYYCD
jgi:6-phosphogluconolactonase